VTYSLPAGTAVGGYLVVATYNPSSNFTGSTDSAALAIGARSTLTAAAPASSTYSEQATNVTLSATVSATPSTVYAGTVTFQVRNGANTADVGVAVTDSTIVAGAASVTYSLPAGTAVGGYLVVATYNPSSNFTGSTDSAALAIGARSTVTAADNSTAIYGDSPVTLTATVSATPSTVYAGTVTFQVKNGATNVGSAVTSGTVSAGAASVIYSLPGGTAAGSYTIVATYNPSSNFTGSTNSATLTIGKAELTVTADAQTRQYSDANPPLTVSYTGFKSPDTLASSDVTGGPSCTTPATPLGSWAASYTITCQIGSLNSNNYTFRFVSGLLNVSQEDASLDYTGDTIGVTNTNLTLEATVKDSAAASYAGPRAELGGTVGDITKIWIRFDIYTGTTCGTGTPLTSKYAQVTDTGTAGDGVGTARTTYASSAESTYCVIARLVASDGSTNLWYAPLDAEQSVLTFYNNSGQFVTGGGWITDPSSNHGNFGFNARYNKNGKAQGQMVYVYRDLYNGVPATFVIKSNALTALGFTGITYPIKANLQGGANISITRNSDGATLFSEGAATFDATVTDSGQSSGIGLDDYSLTVTRNGGTTPFKYVPRTLLKGGNIVIHLK
jgi:MBG domain (YGX type)/Bacterial Ig-like domain (group 3)